MDKKYKKHELRTHIYEIPDTYIGSVELTQLEVFLYDEETKRMIKKTISYVPGLYKIYDEIVVNALDQITRLKQSEIKKELENIRHVKNIKFTIDRDTGYIEIENDGDGIDIDILPNEGGIYIPQMILGELLTSSNYTEKDVEKLVGGKGGFGSKLTNIFSLNFTAETVDHRRKKIYTQTWEDNMKTVGKPIVKSYAKVPYTKIRFLPDYKRFGLDGLTDDMYELFYKRALDACATSDATVNVFFNGTKLEIKSFEKYADLYLGSKTDTPRVYESSERWEVIAAPNTSSQFEQVSFVNGINTVRGGKHVDYIKNQITKKLVEMAESKKKTVKANHIADNLFLSVKCLIINPSFDTQTKECLTTPVAKFGSKFELSDKFMTGLFKSGIIEKAARLTDFHQDKKAAKTDGKKTSRIYGVEKLDDANDAGTKNSAECTLILTEGDSAKALAIAGLSVIGRQKYGVYPLRGKIMNVDDATAQKIADNKEITELKKILGLQNGKVYKDKSETRYGRILALVDQDSDGHHIKGLLFNLFHSLWPSLYKMDDFLISLKTPLMKAFHTSGQVISFYTMQEVNAWIENKKKTGMKGWTFKYYKGLGTSTSSEAKEYFKDMKTTKYIYNGKESDEAMSLAFNKKRADDRKEWLMKYDPNNALDYQKQEVSYEDFVNKELIIYSEENLLRSINHFMDGLKDSTRKIVYAGFKRKLFHKEMKVAQFAAYTAEASDYHHGEQSLNLAIVGMAQNFVGSNNINIFKPNGQFGTRIQGGSDASATRYIFTLLTELAQLIFRVEDFKVLEYNVSDGQKIEPKYYVPVVPMVVINGAQGIATGFSTNLPNHNPSEVIAHCKVIAELIEQDPNIQVDDIELADLIPWYLGFKGKIDKKDDKDGVYESHGIYSWIKDDLIEVTELPIGTWTDDYKEFLTKSIVNNNPVLKDFESHYTETHVKFILKLYPGVRAGIEMNFDAEFKLVSTKNLNTNNIHLITQDGTIKKFSGTTEIIKRFAKIRLETYEKRKDLELKLLRKQEKIISAKVKFIKEYIEDVIILAGKNIADVEAQLKALGYPTISDEIEEESDEEVIVKEPTYDYLTDMPLKTLTNEKKKALEKQEENVKMKISELEQKSIPSMWIDELHEVEIAWNKFRGEIESQNSVVSTNKVKGKKK